MEVTHHQIIDKFPDKISPKNNDIESLKVASGDIRFYLNQKCLKELFPNLFEFSEFSQSRFATLSSPGSMTLIQPSRDQIHFVFRGQLRSLVPAVVNIYLLNYF